MDNNPLYVKRIENQILVSRHREFKEGVLTLSLGQAALLADTLTRAQNEKFVRADLAEPEALLGNMALQGLDHNTVTKQ